MLDEEAIKCQRRATTGELKEDLVGIQIRSYFRVVVVYVVRPTGRREGSWSVGVGSCLFLLCEDNFYGDPRPTKRIVCMEKCKVEEFA